MKAMLETALRASRIGGAILRNKFGTDLHIEHKGEIDLVTEADRAAESAIVAAIRSDYPHHGIVAEEYDYEKTVSDYCWVIDPLDGTTNFAHGFPWFAVSIGLRHRNEMTLGIVYNPIYEELYVAVKGEGATLNGRPLRVSRTSELGNSLLSTGFPYNRRDSTVNNFDHFVNFQKQAQACRRPGAASLDLAAVAAGRFDGFWEMSLKPWDTAAGSLLVSEAGGVVSDFDGRSFDINGPECLASNGLIHQTMIDILRQGKRP